MMIFVKIICEKCVVKYGVMCVCMCDVVLKIVCVCACGGCDNVNWGVFVSSCII